MRSLISRLLFGLCAISPFAMAAPPGDLALTPVVTSGIGSPIAIRHAGDGSGRLFIAGRYGQIWIKPAGSSSVLATPFINLSGTAPFGLSISGEGGLLSMAFHPNYASNRLFYVHYTDGSGDTAVVRYTASAANPNIADTATAQVVIRIDQDSNYHKGGDLHFGPDGYLYVSLGDGAGGNGTDGCNRAQTLRPSQLAANDANHSDCPADAAFTNSGGSTRSRALLGKILRIDVNQTTAAGTNELCAANANGSANYGIPAGNPYAGTAGTAGNCDEIWAYGLRNPFRFSFDRQTGQMFIGDVGESQMEEIDMAAPGTGGVNYGWDLCEGTSGNCAGSTPPILTYTHTANAGPCASVTGGVRYRGAISGMSGTYIYADFCSGRIHFGVQNGGTWSSTQWQDGTDLLYTGFGEDEAGEVYLTEMDGDRVLRFTSSQTDVIFADGFGD
ncbi:PQQ-dependent sugar dehydrogenase [Tahibacter amnicola]|uniref:PQQ-dependent sugar dehydrogenase n=1 Tax=Tahibacter amnicola TaxID=2976241 RepID=A0ABY6BBH0_9GAMM|nr:PQQ-dependent sugar dehydrogenase [Tahibacter amnicola]UXI66886.1 PQQ-dependent sugar dehydrogenase [Tahibacter amnicola]